jgi:hypothetical protein
MEKHATVLQSTRQLCEGAHLEEATEDRGAVTLVEALQGNALARAVTAWKDAMMPDVWKCGSWFSEGSLLALNN